MKPYTTYKYYDQKGRRLSIFGRNLDNKLVIDIITCSKKDEFSKKKGRELFNEYIELLSKNVDNPLPCYPIQILVEIENEKPGYSFIKFCNNNFYKKTTILRRLEQDVLEKNMAGRIYIGKPREYYKKMDQR